KTFVPSRKTGKMIMEGNGSHLTSLTADIVAAYVANNALTSDKNPEFIGSVYTALHKASVQTSEPPKIELVPAVSVKKSLTPEYIICLEDGKKFKSLKRHIRTHYDLSPDAYRAKWGLPHDYPMVAPAMLPPVRIWPKAWDLAGRMAR